MEKLASPIQTLKNGQWYQIYKVSGNSDVPAFCNAARQFLANFSEDGLSFDYAWFTVSDDVTYIVASGTRTAMVVLDSYLAGHTHYIEHAYMVRQGRGAKAFQAITADLYAKRVPVKGRHSQGSSRV